MGSVSREPEVSEDPSVDPDAVEESPHAREPASAPARGTNKTWASTTDRAFAESGSRRISIGMIPFGVASAAAW
jgi:hypothetical protein